MPSSTSKNKRKKPTDHQPKQARYGSSWKNPLVDIECPSGATAQVRRPGVQGLIKAGVLHSMDQLTSIVQTETIPKSQGLPGVTDADIREMVEDQERFTEMMDMMDKVVMYVVVQPKLHPYKVPVLDEETGEQMEKDGKPVMHELTDEERAKAVEVLRKETGDDEAEIIYVDWVDAEDKTYIMNFAVGGTRDLEKFREEAAALVGGVPAGEADEDAAS